MDVVFSRWSLRLGMRVNDFVIFRKSLNSRDVHPDRIAIPRRNGKDELLNRLPSVIICCFLLCLLSPHSIRAESSPNSRNLAPDQPGEEEVFNRELWEFSKKTPYEEVENYVERAQQASRATVREYMTLPNGWKIAPPGIQVEVGRLPLEAVAYAGHIVVLNTGYYYKEPQEISVVDPETAKVVKVLHLASIFPSAGEGLDGDLYISGGFSQAVHRLDKKFDIVRNYPVKGYAGGLTALDVNHLAVVYTVAGKNQQEFERGSFEEGKLAILNTVTGDIEREATVGYFPHSVRFLNGKLYVTVLGEDKLKIYDSQLNLLKALDVGRIPQALCPDGNNLYVVNTGSDSLSLVDTLKDTVISTMELGNKKYPFGIAPTSCAVSGNRIFVTQATGNSVAVFDTKTHRPQGSIPAGWYPSKIIFHGKRMFVLSAKGIRPRRPNVDGPQPIPEKGGSQYVLTLLKGSLSIVPESQITSRLAAWTKTVEKGSPLYSPRKGLNIPIRHIFYIIRENRTFDQVLGDLPRGNCDPYLTLFGRAITPNAHKLSEQYVTLDNYYANGEISVLGHSYTTSGYAGPFLQWVGNARYSGRYPGYPFGMVPAVTSPAYLWDALDDAAVDYRIYGENYFLYTRAYRLIKEALGEESELAKKFYARMMFLAGKVDRGDEFYAFANPFYGRASTPEDAWRLLDNPEFTSLLSRFLCGDETLAKAIRENDALHRKFAEYIYRYPCNYRSWDLKYSDIDRVRAWKTDFEKQIQLGRVAQLHYIWLPNDHTGGTDPEYLNPYQLVAQNDAALGMIVEAISKSPVWKNSLILVTEDDAQDGPDHVDATRTVALAAGPYVKRNAVINDRYDQLSLLRTIEMLLGLKPINMADALAVPMFGIFSRIPSGGAYTASPPSDSLAESDRVLYLQSGK
jgi:YVTN family beta-propeller protein